MINENFCERNEQKNDNIFTDHFANGNLGNTEGQQ